MRLSVTLVLKNNIGERIIKQGDIDTTQATTQATQATTQADQDIPVEERILFVIKENPPASQTQMAAKLGISVESVKYYIRKMWADHIIAREGTNQKGKWLILK